MTHGDWLDSFVAIATDLGETTSLATLAAALAIDSGADLDEAMFLARVIAPGIELDPRLVASLTPPAAVARVDLLGKAKAALVPGSTRKVRGVHYTPQETATGLTAVALRGFEPVATVCDPTVGGGVFLLSAADHLLGAGAAPDVLVAEQLFGADLDQASVAVSRVSLGLWAYRHLGRAVVPPDTHLTVGNPLVGGSEIWPGRPACGFDAVLGNPPFLGQMKSATARGALRSRAALERHGDLAKGYVDDAGLFLAVALDLVRPGGHVALILPQSLLSTRDGQAVRAEVMRRATLSGIWVAEDVDFAASVRVWAPILRVNPQAPTIIDASELTRALVDVGADLARVPDDPSSGVVAHPVIARFVGATVKPVGVIQEVPDACSWAPLVADLMGGIDLGLDAMRTDATLARIATATAGFRKQFYGLIPFVRDLEGTVGGVADPTGCAPLITAGAIDPLHDRSSTTTTHFAGVRHDRPIVDLTALAEVDSTLATWVQARRRPKVLVAPQSAVIEALLDEQGDLVPSTPVVSVEPIEPTVTQASLVAALLCAPTTSAWAFGRTAGSGLGTGTMRVPARVLLDVPLPGDHNAWRRGALLAREASVAATAGDGQSWERAIDELARSMNAAFGLDPDHPVFDWWQSRRPQWRP